MRILKHAIYSQILQRPMPVAIYGHFGVPVMIFPTAAQDFEEYERMGMIETLKEFVNEGMVKLYCVSSINAESWMNRRLHVADGARLQAL